MSQPPIELAGAVVSVSWDRINGPSSTRYRINGIGEDGQVILQYVGTDASTTWQAEEDTAYTLSVEAYSAGDWSSPSDPEEAYCPPPIGPTSPEWVHPDFGIFDAPSIISPELITHECDGVVHSSDGTRRTCRSTWKWYQDIPITDTTWRDYVLVNDSVLLTGIGCCSRNSSRRALWLYSRACYNGRTTSHRCCCDNRCIGSKQ